MYAFAELNFYDDFDHLDFTDRFPVTVVTAISQYSNVPIVDKLLNR